MAKDGDQPREAATHLRDGCVRAAAESVAVDLLPPQGLTQDARDEPLFGAQWHLGSASGFDINLGNVWDDYTGAGISVAVIDTGIDPNHPDLDGNIDPVNRLNSRTGSTSATSGNPQTGADNHGTTVAGVIAAEDNGIGVVGVAYEATLVSIYTPLTTSAFAQRGLVFAQNFDVVNNSWGYGGGGDPFYVDFDDTLRRSGEDASFAQYGTAIRDTAEDGRGGLGTIIVFSAGNNFEIGDDTNLSNFTNSRYTITVGATQENGEAASFSTAGASILIAAPGVDIATTDRPGSAGFVPNLDPASLGSNDYVEIDGTSFSAPVIAAVSALVLQANGGLGARDVQEILATSARTILPEALAWQTNGAANWNGGGMTWSYDYGSGLVDAHAAVRLAETWFLEDVFGLGTATAATFTNEATATGSAAPNLAIPDNNEAGISTTLNLTGNVLMDQVEVHLDINHTFVGDLIAEVVSPAGTSAIILLQPYLGSASENNIDFTFSTTFFWGETSAGTWTLNVFDLGPDDIGTLIDWTVTAYGDAIPVDDTYYYTNDFGGVLAAEAARATLSDGEGNDTINIAAVESASTLDLGAGNGQIAGRALAIADGTVIENIVGGDGADVFLGNDRPNMIFGGRGDDTLVGAEGADRLVGGAGDDRLVGDNGDDTFIGGEGVDRLYGGAGSDWVAFDDSGDSVIVVLHAGYSNGVGLGRDRLVAVENARGAGLADLLIGDDGANTLLGGAGDDNLVGYGGDDLLDGEADNDRLRGQDGDDILMGGVGDDGLEGGSGNDTLLGGAGVDRLIGDAGSDWVAFGDTEGAVIVVLHAGYSNGEGLDRDRLIDIENAVGSQHGDLLIGDDGVNTLLGGGGDDNLVGYGGNDLLDGEADNDWLRGQDGNDTLLGDVGDDTLEGGAGDDLLLGGAGRDRLNGDEGSDTLFGGAGVDRLDGGDGIDWVAFGATAGPVRVVLHAGYSNGDGLERDRLIAIENASGSQHDDLLIGDDGANVLLGEGGDDVLAGQGGADSLAGGAGNDWLRGQDGDDTLAGGLGSDLVEGGAGSDVFVFADGDGFDTVADFTVGTDRIDLSAVAAITDFADLTANHVTQVGGDVWIEDGGGDRIVLLGVAAGNLDEADFLF